MKLSNFNGVILSCLQYKHVSLFKYKARQCIPEHSIRYISERDKNKKK